MSTPSHRKISGSECRQSDRLMGGKYIWTPDGQTRLGYALKQHRGWAVHVLDGPDSIRGSSRFAFNLAEAAAWLKRQHEGATT